MSTIARTTPQAGSTIASMPTLPSELLLRIKEQATPSVLHLVIGGSDSDIVNSSTAPRLSVANVDEWRSVRGLMSLTPEMAALTGKQSRIPFSSSLRITFCKCTHPAQPDRSVPHSILAKFDSMDIEVPWSMKAPEWTIGPDDAEHMWGIMKMRYQRHNGGWKLVETTFPKVESDNMNPFRLHRLLPRVAFILQEHFKDYMEDRDEGPGGTAAWLQRFRDGLWPHMKKLYPTGDQFWNRRLPICWLINLDHGSMMCDADDRSHAATH